MVDLAEGDEILAVRFVLLKQSSLAPERGLDKEVAELELREDGNSSISSEGFDIDDIDPRIRLMYLVNEGDLEGIKELLDSGTDVNFKDIDNRTALHVAACQWYIDVVQFLLQNGAEVDPKDRWGSTLSNDIIFNDFILHK
ncbi:hypothetical protein Leryth_026738 [Lithospermum erythrorhizon]|nr:hypothetical protein Leryth_026738 [Lithospermum erythrorhizon]